MRLLDQAGELVYRKFTVLYSMLLSCTIRDCAVLLSTVLDQCCVVLADWQTNRLALSAEPGAFRPLLLSSVYPVHAHARTHCVHKQTRRLTSFFSLSLSLQSVVPSMHLLSEHTGMFSLPLSFCRYFPSLCSLFNPPPLSITVPDSSLFM